MINDHYIISDKTIKKPPRTLLGGLRFLGPGFILSASIVGSGELIATTTLGARAGFIAFWVIIVSCLIKVALQLEFGKQAIMTGETVMRSFNKLPGPRGKHAGWAVWTVFILMCLKVVQLGGIIGGVSVVLYLLFPVLPLHGWVIAVVITVAMMIYRGYYRMVEKASLVMIAVFTITTITALVVLRHTSYSITWQEIVSGLRFRLPPEIVGVAIGAFGITGVGSDEILAYNYWCIEKGYAAFCGPRDDSDEWKRRARGWIRVMHLDALMAMLIYTSVTAAFYLLGAAILNGRTLIPEGNGVIETLALIYTESLGPGARILYLAGAFFVLFSSVFASLAAWTRLFSDIAGQMGWIDFFNISARRKTIAWLAWILPAAWAAAYFFIRLPLLMILSGGIIGSVLLFLVAFAAIHFYRKRVPVIPSGITYTAAFAASVILIIAVGVYGLVQLF